MDSATSEQLHHLWSTASDFSPVESTEVLREFTSGVCDLLQACNCSWLCAVRGQAPADAHSMTLFDGWWFHDLINFDPKQSSQENTAIFLALTRQYGHAPTSLNAVKQAGKTRVHLRRDVHSDEEWTDFWLYREFLAPLCEVGDRMLAVFSLAPDRDSYLIIDRPVGAPYFDEADRRLAYLATAGARPLHHRLFFERGLLPPATKQLSPRERQIFSYLLTDLSEKEIAEKVSLSVHTVHQYTSSIYRTFRVRGRIGLLASYLQGNRSGAAGAVRPSITI
ncbi:MAG: helix-turn-helix transcriptional regulator [Verrucomicrobiota bacterium JB023]|nr:helix-turn-helix transcriptional regulator [Verrucomicrobiota bacterium JB023]